MGALFIMIPLALWGASGELVWHRAVLRPPLEPVWVSVGPAVDSLCRDEVHRGERPLACADVVSRAGEGVCLIYGYASEIDSPTWLVEHEKKHCAGYDHE